MEAKGNDVTEEILRTAGKENIDTIVVGSRGVKILHKYMLVIGGYLDQLNVWKVPEVLDPRLRINLDGSIS